jgi:hypothetical protein
MIFWPFFLHGRWMLGAKNFQELPTYFTISSTLNFRRGPYHAYYPAITFLFHTSLLFQMSRCTWKTSQHYTLEVYSGPFVEVKLSGFDHSPESHRAPSSGYWLHLHLLEFFDRLRYEYLTSSPDPFSKFAARVRYKESESE